MYDDHYVIYQSEEAANAIMEAMELLPGKVNLSLSHYISDEAAMANLKLARQLAAILSSDE